MINNFLYNLCVVFANDNGDYSTGLVVAVVIFYLLLLIVLIGIIFGLGCYLTVQGYKQKSAIKTVVGVFFTGLWFGLILIFLLKVWEQKQPDLIKNSQTKRRKIKKSLSKK